MGLTESKRQFLVGFLGELPVALLEAELSRKSRELERTVAWKEGQPLPCDPFIALLNRERRVPTNNRAREMIVGKSRVDPFIRDVHELLRRETPTLKL